MTTDGLLRSYSSGWDTLAGHAPALIYHSEVAALPDGRVFWVVGTGAGTDYLVTP